MASPPLLSFPHLFLGWIYGSGAFQVSAGGSRGFSGALQAPLAPRSTKNFPSDWRKARMRILQARCHAGSLALWKPFFFFPWASPIDAVERGDYGRGGAEKRALLNTDSILELSAVPLSSPLPLK